MSTALAPSEPDLLRAISALAVIKVNWDDDKDYIANFVPIVAHCLRSGDRDEISMPETQELIEATFGLRIPQGPLRTLLSRMAREGLVERRHRVYVRMPDALAQIDLGSTRADVLRQHAHLVDLLVAFAARQGREWSEEQAETALLGYVEVLAEPILGAVVDGDPVVDLPKVDQDGSVLTSQFVLDLAKKEPQAFDYLVTIVKGTMLANVLFLPAEFAGGRTRLCDIAVFLDTPIVLCGLGYAEEPYRVPAEELLQLLTKRVPSSASSSTRCMRLRVFWTRRPLPTEPVSSATTSPATSSTSSPRRTWAAATSRWSSRACEIALPNRESRLCKPQTTPSTKPSRSKTWKSLCRMRSTTADRGQWKRTSNR